MALQEQSNLAINMKTREEIVADTLRAAILRGTFKPGEKLDQQELAERLGVSRSPIREALRTLAAEELVTNVPHRGAVVTERTTAELEELLFIRSLLEGVAAKRAAPRITDEQLKKIEAVLIQGEESNDLEEVLGLNNDFHNMIYESYEQPVLIATIQQLRNKIAPYNRVFLEKEGQKNEAWEDHRRIYEAFLARDGEKAEAETIKHLRRVFEGFIAEQQ